MPGAGAAASGLRASICKRTVAHIGTFLCGSGRFRWFRPGAGWTPPGWCTLAAAEATQGPWPRVESSRHHPRAAPSALGVTVARQPPSPARLRQLALGHQGLAGKRKLGSGLAGARKVLERIGYVQIDTISVVARAHHHTFFTRVSKYDEGIPNRLVKRGLAFEYWGHAAAYLPMRDYRFALPMMRAVREGRIGWNLKRDEKVRAWVRDRIRDEGPLFARDFEDPRQTRKGWWDWKPAKRALEQLFMEGELMSIERQGFQKRYDLAERVLPGDARTAEPSADEHADHVIDQSLTAHGFATEKTICFFRRDARVRADVRARLKARAARGDLVARRSASGALLYARPGALDGRNRKPAGIVRILSPFDNVVIQRQRGVEVFDFDYTIECYTPEAKRQFGYFALPIVFADALVGRMDCKAHRPEGRFEIKALFLEREPPDAFLPAFASAVFEYAAFTGCDEVQVGRVRPGKWAKPLKDLFVQPP